MSSTARKTLVLCDTALPLVPLVAASSGNTYHALPSVRTADGVTKSGVAYKKGDFYMHPYGQQIPALADTLPTSATIDGVTVFFTSATTDDGRQKVSSKGHVTLPTGEANGEVRRLDATISVTKSGDWNIKVAVTGVGTRTVDTKSNLDALQSILAPAL